MELIDWYIIEKAILTRDDDTRKRSVDRYIKVYYGQETLIFVKRMRTLVREAD